MAFHRSAFLAAGLVALAACNSAPAAEEAEPQLLPPPAEATAEMDFESKLAVGKLLAETHCSGCHAIGPEGDSPHEEAKPFRKLSQNYPVSDLAEAFAEGIIVGHPDMPVFTLNPYEIDALITYLESIQDPHPV